MFTAHDLLFVYPGPPPERPPLDLRGLTLTLPAGGTVALLGESGSGKSTLLNLLGLLWDRPPAAGSVVYHHGRTTAAAARLSRRQHARLRRDEFGFIFQSSFLLPHFTVEQNVAVPLELGGLGRAAIRERVGALLAITGLEDLARRPARTLSGGQRQRVAVLRAIVHDPVVVFADEPASSLDRHNAEVIHDLLARWRRGQLGFQADRPAGIRTLFLVSHNLREVRRMHAESVLLLFDGQVVGGRAYPIHALDDAAIYAAVERGVEPRLPAAAEVEPGAPP
jgi:ABC-type lipoprotein export system ATPase subunit